MEFKDLKPMLTPQTHSKGEINIFIRPNIIEVEQSRYDELIKKEERLHAIETAIKSLGFYHSDFELFKKMFELKEE